MHSRVCRRAILMHTERVCYAFIFEDIANLRNVNLGLEKLRLSPHHLPSPCSWESQPCAHGAGGEQDSTVVKLNSSCLQEAWKDSPPLEPFSSSQHPSG